MCDIISKYWKQRLQFVFVVDGEFQKYFRDYIELYEKMLRRPLIDHHRDEMKMDTELETRQIGDAECSIKLPFCQSNTRSWRPIFVDSITRCWNKNTCSINIKNSDKIELLCQT